MSLDWCVQFVAVDDIGEPCTNKGRGGGVNYVLAIHCNSSLVVDVPPMQVNVPSHLAGQWTSAPGPDRNSW